MKFYIAAKFSEKDDVQIIQEKIVAAGHSLVCDWTRQESFRPYKEHQKESAAQSKGCIDSTIDCDVFILFTKSDGRGMLIEYGAALASHAQKAKPAIYLIGEHSSPPMFYYHPSVKWKKSIEEVLSELK